MLQLTRILERCTLLPCPISCATIALTIDMCCMRQLLCFLSLPRGCWLLNPSSLPTAWCLLIALWLQLFLVIFPARLERSRQGMLLGDAGHRPLR